MITRSASRWQTEDWQIQLSGAITNIPELLDRVQLSLDQLPEALQAAQQFALRVPQRFVDKMIPGDPCDPLLLQVLPLAAELQRSDGYIQDPLAEHQMRRHAGLLHKYRSRILIVLSGACGINCRYCFRRHFDYQDNRLAQQDIDQIIAYVQADTGINEIILSGGDPLVVSNRRLDAIITALETVPHVKRLRIHSRMPVVIPQRIDHGLLTRIAQSRLRFIMVVHANHAAELDADFISAMNQLAQQGVMLLNQSVLLKGVNDQADTLVELSETLFDAGVQPYYLHLLDPVAGAAHFDVNESQARGLMRSIMARLPGYLVPRLVREVPGELSKTAIALI